MNSTTKIEAIQLLWTRPPEVDFVPGIQMLKTKYACPKAGKLSLLKIFQDARNNKRGYCA